jgi:hypothetical protein
MEYIIVASVAFYLGWKICETIQAMAFKQILEDLKVSDETMMKMARDAGVDVSKYEDAKSPTITIELKVEQHGDQLYAYETEKDTFVAQSKSADDLLDRIMKKYPTGTKIVIDRDHGGDLVNDAVVNLKNQSAT